MNKAAILCLLSLMFVQSACAASFDCEKATTKVEKMICADPELSKLDEDLSVVYSKALKESSDPTILKLQQRGWLKERNQCNDLSCLGGSYKSRLVELSQVVPSFVTIAPPDVSEFDVDCAKPKGEKEKLVCVEAQTEHRSMIVSLQWALMRSKDKQKVIDAQRLWQQQVRDVCQDGYCLRVKAYQPRIEELRKMSIKQGQCYIPMPILDANGYVEPIEPVCQAMEINLNQFCEQPPMVCQLKVAPEFQKRITFPKWKALEPHKNIALIEEFIRAPWVDRPIEESIWKKEKEKIDASIASKRLSFSESKLDLYNLGKDQTSYRLDYGTCYSDNLQLNDKNEWDAPLTSSPVQVLYEPEIERNINKQYFVMMRSPLHDVFLFEKSIYDYFMFGATDKAGINVENLLGVNRFGRKLFEGDKNTSVVMKNECRFIYRSNKGAGK